MGKLIKIIDRNITLLLRGSGLGFFDKLKLKLTKRYKKGVIAFFNHKFEFTDASSFVSTYEEIFIRKIYEFSSTSDQPFIIDCGANVGLSIVYFKMMYPNARIIAFEPDNTIFDILSKNIKQRRLKDVELLQKAVWNSNENLTFFSQGGLSGSLVSSSKESLITVKAFRLKELLNRPVDFLKIDIEGAEYEVLMDCRDELKNVKKLFIEYHSYINKPQVLDEILAVVKSAGFRFHIHEATTLSTSPYIKINTVQDMDLQLNIFAYR